MDITRKLSLTALSILAMVLPTQAFASDMTQSAAEANQPAPQVTRAKHSPKLHTTAHIKAMTAKRTIRVVREPLPQHSQATRINTQGRFVIATDGSKDTMKVFQTVKHSTSMPNLYKN